MFSPQTVYQEGHETLSCGDVPRKLLVHREYERPAGGNGTERGTLSIHMGAFWPQVRDGERHNRPLWDPFGIKFVLFPTKYGHMCHSRGAGMPILP